MQASACRVLLATDPSKSAGATTSAIAAPTRSRASDTSNSAASHPAASKPSIACASTRTALGTTESTLRVDYRFG